MTTKVGFVYTVALSSPRHAFLTRSGRPPTYPLHLDTAKRKAISHRQRSAERFHKAPLSCTRVSTTLLLALSWCPRLV